jgi:signal transduction histidine kinase
MSAGYQSSLLSARLGSGQNVPKTAPAEDDYSGLGLRLALLIGLGGIALTFLVAGIDAMRLLATMRAENKVLRDAALQRTNHIASIRSCIMLSRNYFLDSDQQKATEYLAKVQDARSRSMSDLANYQATTLEERESITNLGNVLNQHWVLLTRVLTTTPIGKPVPASFYKDEIAPLSASFVQISAQLEGIDAKQAATTQAAIESQFERLGSQLSSALGLGLGAALLLAAGCLLYISRVERQNSRRYREVLQARRTLEQLSARLVDAQEKERRTISRELHDQVGQTLNAVLVEAANLAPRIHADDALSRQYLDNIRKFADSSVNSIRDIALLLRPSMLDDLGLIPALEWQAREVSRRSGIHIKIVAEDLTDSLPDEVRTCIYRLVQEALQNVSRHSGAKNASVTVRQEGGSVFLSVEDDGHGFAPDKTRGLGMLGMEERVRQLRGQFQVQSSPGKGTAIRVTLPVPVAQSIE